jgi:hypothetical protein
MPEKPGVDSGTGITDGGKLRIRIITESLEYEKPDTYDKNMEHVKNVNKSKKIYTRESKG